VCCERKTRRFGRVCVVGKRLGGLVGCVWWGEDRKGINLTVRAIDNRRQAEHVPLGVIQYRVDQRILNDGDEAAQLGLFVLQVVLHQTQKSQKRQKIKILGRLQQGERYIYIYSLPPV
jgi:hypothetical protein